MNRGFTLIETIVYMALLGILLTGAILASYQLLMGASSLDSKNTAGEEGGFVLRKLDWAFGSAKAITVPVSGASGSTLSLSRHDGIPVDFRLNGAAIEIRENGGTYYPITTSDAAVSSLQFEHIASVGTAPEGLKVTFVANGLTFTLTRYLRQ